MIGLPRQKIALPRQNRAWTISHFCRAIESKVADYPRSFTKRKIFHARSSENPRSTRMTGTGPAFVSICNSKRVIPPPSVTDRDITQRPQLTSHSVTARTVFGLFVLQIETNLKLGGSQTRLHIDINRNGPCPIRNRARNSHGASDRNRTCNPLITNQLRYRCATLAHLALSREAS